MSTYTTTSAFHSPPPQGYGRNSSGGGGYGPPGTEDRRPEALVGQSPYAPSPRGGQPFYPPHQQDPYGAGGAYPPSHPHAHAAYPGAHPPAAAASPYHHPSNDPRASPAAAAAAGNYPYGGVYGMQPGSVQHQGSFGGGVGGMGSPMGYGMQPPPSPMRGGSMGGAGGMGGGMMRTRQGSFGGGEGAPGARGLTSRKGRQMQQQPPLYREEEEDVLMGGGGGGGGGDGYGGPLDLIRQRSTGHSPARGASLGRGGSSSGYYREEDDGPPPTDSLMDLDADGAAGAQGGRGRRAAAGVGRERSSLDGGEGQPLALRDPDADAPRWGATVGATAWANWAVVFGFPRELREAVVSQFALYGTLQETAHDDNWLLIKYATRTQAEKAIAQNGTLLRTTASASPTSSSSSSSQATTPVLLAVSRVTPETVRKLGVALDPQGGVQIIRRGGEIRPAGSLGGLGSPLAAGNGGGRRASAGGGLRQRGTGFRALAASDVGGSPAGGRRSSTGGGGAAVINDSDLLKPAGPPTHLLAWIWLFLCRLFNWK